MDWSEPFIRILFSLEIIWLVTLFLTRSRRFLLAHLIALAGMTFLLQTMNDYGNQNYQKFSKTNYFDVHGVFICTVLGLPIIFLIVLVLIKLARA